MAASLVGGAALGPVFDLLYKAVFNVRTNIATFRFKFLSLKQTLVEMKPVFTDIETLNNALDGRDEEIEMFKKRLMEGEELVRKCSKTKWYDVFMTLKYSSELTELENSLLKFCLTLGLIQVLRDGKLILLKVSENAKTLEKIHSMMSNGSSNGFSGSSDVPQVPYFMVGFEVLLQELKLKLLQEKVRVLVLSAPPGCGKTTVAAKLCQEDDIKDKYRDIFFVTVTKTPNIKRIVGQIFEKKHGRVPEFATEHDAICQLSNLLIRSTSQPILLVLDDVWSESEFIIENLTLQIPGFKILVTSRFVFPKFDTYKLKLLSEKDSKDLFCTSAFIDGIPNVKLDLVHKREMVASLLGGAALGPVFDLLYKAVLNVGINIGTFRSNFLSLKQTLVEIQPVFTDIERLNKALDGRDEEIEMFMKRLMEGEELVRKCSKTKCYDALKKWNYSRKLTKLENSLLNFFQIHGLIQVVRDNKLILVKVGENGKTLEEIHSMMRNISLGSSSSIGFTNSSGSSFGSSTDSPPRELGNNSVSNMQTSTDSPIPPPAPDTDIVRDVILWKKKSCSVVALLAATAIWMALDVYGLTFITLFSWISMFVIAFIFLWSNMHMLLGKEPLDMSRMYISDESVVEAGTKFLDLVERSLRFLLSVSTEKEWFIFLGTVASLGLLSVVASYFDLLTLLYIGVVMGLTVPVVYVKYEDRIKDVGQLVRVRWHTYYCAVSERCHAYYTAIAKRVKKTKSKLKKKKNE